MNIFERKIVNEIICPVIVVQAFETCQLKNSHTHKSFDLFISFAYKISRD